MKFKKIVTIGINEADLETRFWERVDALAGSRITISSEDDPKVSDELADTDCLLVKFNGAPKKILEKAPNLKYVGALATGYGKIDLKYSNQKGIVVTNVPGYSTESVAEFVIAVILERVRQLSNGLEQVRQGNYSEDGFAATEIKGKNFGVVGLGDIGNRVAELAAGFGASVSYYSRQSKAVEFRYSDLDGVLQNSDLLSINLALTSETEGLLDAKKIGMIKEGAIVVNTAPMELLDFDALVTCLEKGKFTFITDHSDEMDKEKLERLKAYDNCVLYPPIAYISDEARVAKQEIFVGNMTGFLQGKVQNKVN